ncbi:hypothetical protein [uncultured Aquimarina sp.]|uniref:hypothetical protein n=1 Tax=uncultured Aquimarina sp. TaxID=575652 RepID=UPI002635A20D|nr:hypothetical protein [uncultured Aquimarina sp.]
MNKFLSYLNLTLIVLMISCGSDDDANPTNETGDINTTIEILTSNSQKPWRIETAIITTPGKSGSLDVSDEYNIKDDVFIFSNEIKDNPNVTNENASVIWKQREAVNWNATSLEDIYMDKYEDELVLGIEIPEGNPNTFSGFNGLSDFIVTDNSITGKIEVATGVFLEITLSPVLETDLPIIPESLIFKEVAEYTLSNLPGVANTLGFTGSNANNKLYISRRGEVFTEGCEFREEDIISFDIDTKEFDINISCQPSGFATKELEIINNRLVSVSSNSINVYDTDMLESPTIYEHDPSFSRHGTATIGDDIFIVGSLFEGVSDKLYKFNTLTNQFSEVTSMPKEKLWADGEILDNKLYIFGGQDNLFDNIIGSDDILIYDLYTNEWDNLTMTKLVNDTFTGRYQNLICVGGSIWVDNNDDGQIDELNGFLGVFNTQDNSFEEVDFELDTPVFGGFRQLTVVRNKLYVITGFENDYTFKIFEADLN